MRDWQTWLGRREPMLLAALAAFALLLRGAAHHFLDLPVESDGAAYLALADSLVSTGVPTDMFGQHGFYSIGYPIVLAPFVALLGAGSMAALAANLILTLLTIILLFILSRALALPAWARLLVIALYAMWLPGIWNAASIARENLSTPLLLAILLASLAILRGARGAVLAAGMLCGAAILAGGSALLLGLAPLTAIVLTTRRSRERLVRSGAVLAGGLVLLLAPWLLAMQAMTGNATLSTSSGFNFYLGHNPAADGRFVSIADTPAGPRWEGMRAVLGEAGASAALAAEARGFIADNPGRAVALAATKLLRFWAPNLPDAEDFAASQMIALVRLGEVAQYLLLLGLGGFALMSGRIARDQRRIVIALIAGFWLIHAAAYIIPRYRDPVMPVFMLLAGAAVARRRAPDVR